MSTPNIPRGPGLFEFPRINAGRVVLDGDAGADRPGSVLIGVGAWLLALIGAGALYFVVSSASTHTCSPPGTRTRQR